MTRVQMVLSQHDREALTARVERKLAGRRISHDAIRATVEQVCSAMDSSGIPVPKPDVIVVMSAASTPDLASRLRHRLERDGVHVAETGVATAGRHTVCALRIAGSDEAAVRAIGQEFGWAFSDAIPAAEFLS
ncbi:MAG: hypothetical protein ABI877_16445 [Gemmatimonadaceae bacterium]